MYNLIKLLSQAPKNKVIWLPAVVGRPVRSSLRRPNRRHSNMRVELGWSGPKLTKSDCAGGKNQDFCLW